MKEVQLLWVYSSEMQAGYGVKSHSHEYYHLISIVEGNMHFTLDNSQFTMIPDDIVLVPPGCTHKFENNTEKSIRYYEVKFTILSQNLSKVLQSLENTHIHDSFACSLVTHIISEYCDNNSFKDDSAMSALLTLIYHLTPGERKNTSQMIGGINTAGCSRPVKKVISFLSDHYSENLSLDAIANGVGITKTYLCNAFKKNTGVTIIECLNMIRIRKAAELIVYSDLSLNQVASLCGYTSPSHFNRTFMRYVGLPPGQCRRAYTGKMLSRDEYGQRHADAFMFSVLAGKSISPTTINDFL